MSAPFGLQHGYSPDHERREIAPGVIAEMYWWGWSFTGSREELQRRLPNTPSHVLDHLEGKTAAEVDEFFNLARWIQTLPDEVFRQAQAIIALYSGHPLLADALMRRLDGGHITTGQVAAEAMRWVEKERERAS